MSNSSRLTPQCIKYKSFSSIILNRFESLNIRLLSQIANAMPRARLPLGGGGDAPNKVDTLLEDEAEAMTVDVPAGAAASQLSTGTGAAGSGAKGPNTPGGGGKKKKKGKR
jgi:signal recognition particle subunit SRP9